MWFKKTPPTGVKPDETYCQTLTTRSGAILRKYDGAGRGNFRRDFRTTVTITHQAADPSQNWSYTCENVIEPHQPWCEKLLLLEWDGLLVAACGEHVVMLDSTNGFVFWDNVFGNTPVVSMALHNGDLYVLYDYAGFRSPDGIVDAKDTRTGNLLKLRSNGDPFWRASRRWDADVYTWFGFDDARLIATTWDCFCCTLDAGTGKVVSSVFTK